MAITAWDIGLFIAFIITLFMLKVIWNNRHFQRKGVKTLPAYPIFGNMGSMLLRKDHLIQLIDRAYNAYPDEKYIGFYQFQRAMLMIRDIELIKQITVKDFDHFQDHTMFVDEDSDPLFGRNLLALTGRKWRDMRATLSPAFTSSKMRNMFTYVAECGELMSKYYLKQIKEIEKTDVMEIEMKNAYTRYTNDVIATSAFGVKVDSLNDPDNEFYKMGKMATEFTIIQLIKSFLLAAFPKITKVFKITLFSPTLSNFFRNLVINQIKDREENNIIRPDMIHLLMEARKGSLIHDKTNETPDSGFATVEESALGKQAVKHELHDDDIVAQAILFFFAGFDTSSTLLSFMTLELALNPDVHKKLQNEIDELGKKCNNQPNYNDIQNMEYMDMVVSETLRKWPPGGLIDRKCSKTYDIKMNNGKNLQINAGDSLWIPAYSIHRDPKYYENPDEFNPERFSEENKSSIAPFTYLPFGAGPRNCIGSRFALMEIKSVVFHMLSKFNFVEIPKTANPLVLDRKSFRIEPEGGFWVGLKSRY